MGAGTRYPPRIFTVTYRSALGRKRKVVMWLKVPYSGIFAMTEVLARALTQRSILWYRVDVPQRVPDERRSELARWSVAFAQSSEITGVDWNV
jgi:hypothetical protein